MSEPLSPDPIAADGPLLGAFTGPSVFVSYASGDRPRALAVTRALEGAGVRAWIDVAGIGGGQSYGPEIVDGIRDCGALVLLCSASSLASRNVRQEVALAWRFGRPILPLRLEPVEFPDALAYWLEGAQWIDVFAGPEEAWLPAALRALERLGATPAGEDRPATGGTVGSDLPDLPVPPTPLLGRATDLADIRRHMDGGGRLLTLTGPGGIGKTRLALEAAQAAAGGFPHGAVFVDLAPVIDPALVLAAVAAALGVREGGDRTLAEELRAYLRPRRLLLVLDNMEQVLGAAEEIAGLLAAAPGLVVIATSRAPLRVRAEHEIAVGPLPLPAADATPAQVAAAAAGELFLERARAAGADLPLTEQNAATIAEIARRLDGLPLAIELAAARTRIFPPEALLRRLEKRLPLLTGGAPDLPERQRTLRGTIAWSHDLLEAEERIAFRRLAVFAGGCSFEAVEAVVAGDRQVDPYEALAALVRQSLLRQERTEGEPRFAMLETIREYALERLEASGEAEAIRERHVRFYLELSGGERPRRRHGDELHAWLTRLEPDHDNLRAALGWAVERPGDELAPRLAANLSQMWYVRGHFAEGRRWLDRALAGTVRDPLLVATARSGAAMLARAQGDHHVAAMHAEAAVAAAREAGDPRTTARALYVLGAVRQFLGEVDGAATALEESLLLARSADDGALIGSILNILGDVAYARGDPTRAVELVEEGLALKRAAGDTVGAGVCLNMLGTMALAERDLARAAARFEEALALFRGAGDPENVAIALNNLGCVARERGEDGRAVGLIAEALIVFRDLGDRSGIAFGLEGLGNVAGRTEAPDLAVRWLAAATAIREAIGEPVAVEQREGYDAFRNDVRDRLGEAAFAEAWAAGTGLDQEAALAEALAWAADPRGHHLCDDPR